VTFQAAPGKPVAKTPPAIELQRVDPDVCPGLAAHGGKLVLGRLSPSAASHRQEGLPAIRAGRRGIAGSSIS
jgi:hypothetical protein